MDNKNWEIIYQTSNLNNANIIKAFLEDNSIMVIIINKKDSVYTSLSGEIHLLVEKENTMRAKHLIAKNNLE